jgi:aspartate kinase
MIVMKFGGSSIESSEAVHRVCRIVKAHVKRRPVVVVSAAGKTTNALLAMAGHASLGRGYSARKALHEVQDLHYRMAGDLLRGPRLEAVETSFQKMFRELHGILHDLSEDGRILTRELSDNIAAFGERLSSELVAGALQETRVPATHVDARELIVTDEHHGSATPLYWATYAKLRRSIPYLTGTNVVVMGGFIGATEAGVTTTLGRGGSDLTASLVGAGIGAEEIQIWTDVDGLLTCDPRVSPAGYRVRTVSYEEAAAMAAAGAKVLHADTVAPAIRQRIPLVIRNSRRPEIEGTRIVPAAPESSNPVKGLAVTEHLLLLEMRSKDVDTDQHFLRILRDFCKRQNVEPALLARRGERVYLGFHNAQSMEALELELAGCVEAHLRSNMAIITLVGDGIGRTPAVGDQAVTIIRRSCGKNIDPILVSDDSAIVQITFAIPQKDARRAYDALHRELFASVDAAIFAPVAAKTLDQQLDPVVSFAMRKTAVFARYALRHSPATGQ